jgi:1-acyl-sn-glycerol-3-phosphate acyltransferase
MHRTIYTTPVVNTLFRGLSYVYLKLTGWKIEGALDPSCRKSVFITAPHTSNWDFPNALTVSFVLGLNVYWMGKSSLFKFPFGGIMRWLGGIAVHREKSNNLVAASAQAIVDADGPVQLLVPPEGTRSKVKYWKTGFYYIAQTANVPIVLAYMDYEQKRIGIGPVFNTTGDIEADMVSIKAFYAPFKGRNADQFHAE